MTTENAVKMINALIAGEVEDGITSSLADHLRAGHAGLIYQETWCKVADFLESGCKKPNHRPPTGRGDKTAGRNFDIKAKYRQLLENEVSCKEAWSKLADEYGLAWTTIRGIVTHA